MRQGRPSSATANDASRPTTTATTGFGSGADLCRPCGETFTILPAWSPPYGHYSLSLPATSLGLELQPGGGWEQSAPQTKDPNRLPDPATLRRWAFRRLLSLCCGLQVLLALLAWLVELFCALPPSLPGIGRRPGVICLWRQTHRDVAGGGRYQTADSVVGLPANTKLETRPVHFSRAADGTVPAAPRPSPQFPRGSRQEPVLLLRLRPGRRRDPLCGTLPPREIQRGDAAASRFPLRRISAERYRQLLPDPVTSPPRGGLLLTTARHPAARSARRNGNRLCSGPVPAFLADAFRLLTR